MTKFKKILIVAIIVIAAFVITTLTIVGGKVTITTFNNNSAISERISKNINKEITNTIELKNRPPHDDVEYLSSIREGTFKYDKENRTLEYIYDGVISRKHMYTGVLGEPKVFRKGKIYARVEWRYTGEHTEERLDK
jgi:hypothetical protein